MLASQTPSTPETPVNPSPNPTASSVWCVPKTGVSDAQLQANLDYACSQGIDCTPIQPGGACFEPNTVASHAAYAMNLLYQSSGKNSWNCDFTQTATLTSSNPSKFSSTSHQPILNKKKFPPGHTNNTARVLVLVMLLRVCWKRKTFLKNIFKNMTASKLFPNLWYFLRF